MNAEGKMQCNEEHALGTKVTRTAAGDEQGAPG